MARKRLSMRKIKEVFRLNHAGISNRAIAKACSIGRESVREYLLRAAEAELSWPLPAELTDYALESMLFPCAIKIGKKRSCPDWVLIHKDLRKKGVTRKLLWIEHKDEDADFYSYSQFCELYKRWSGKLTPMMRLNHKAGETLFVDYAGLTMAYTNPSTGEEKKAYIFVATLGASSRNYVEAQDSQALNSWIGAHVRAFEYFGGVTEVLVPDNLKTGVTSPCFYEPDLNPTYQEMSKHYTTAVIPTRVRRPKDKAKVESGVQVVEYWVIAPLRNRQFFSLSEINQAVKVKLEELNQRVIRRVG